MEETLFSSKDHEKDAILVKEYEIDMVSVKDLQKKMPFLSKVLGRGSIVC